MGKIIEFVREEKLALSGIVGVMLIIGVLALSSVTSTSATAGDLLFAIENPSQHTIDQFGSSFAVTPDGNLLVGVWRDDTGALDAGSVYLYDLTGGSGSLIINNPTPEAGDEFGFVVAVAPNGDLVVGAPSDNTGAPNAGSAYLFNSTDGSLLMTINNPSPNFDDRFGGSIAVTPDGDLLIGAFQDDSAGNNNGIAYLFDGTGGDLLLTLNDPTPTDSFWFGSTVTTNSSGDLIIGEYGDSVGDVSFSGSVHVFDSIDGSLLFTINDFTTGVELVSFFGDSIAVAPNDDIFAAGQGNSAYIFDGSDGSLLLTISDLNIHTEDVLYGSPITVTPNNNLLVGAESENSVHLFDGTDGSLLMTIDNPSSGDDLFGNSVASLPNGDIVIGAPFFGGGGNAGRIYVYEGVWNNSPITDAGSDQTVLEGETAQLDGSGSTDPDGDLITFSWQFVAKPAGSVASLSDSTIVNPTFVADLPGEYVAELVVNDGQVNSAPDQVVVTALTLQEGVGDIVDDVDDLVSGGAINNGQGNSLITRLNVAITQLDSGNTVAAMHQLQSFIEQVNAFVQAGILTPEEAQSLLDAANAILALL